MIYPNTTHTLSHQPTFAANSLLKILKIETTGSQKKMCNNQPIGAFGEVYRNNLFSVVKIYLTEANFVNFKQSME